MFRCVSTTIKIWTLLSLTYPLDAGTRSVSTLTPSQLARKRANDREAQRAIRARTKEHIERLEQELATLRQLGTSKLLQELMRRNQALERQITELGATPIGANAPLYPPSATHMCLGPAPDSPLRTLSLAEAPFGAEGLPPGGSGASSRTSSFGQGSPEYTTSTGPVFDSLFTPSEAPDPWSVVMPAATVSVPSVASSPGSSVSHADDYVPGYIPTSVPTSMMPGGVVPGPTSVPCPEDTKIDFQEPDACERKPP